MAISIPLQRKDTYPYNKNQQDALFTFSVDWQLAGLWILPTASQYKHMTYTNCSIYRVVPPDDEHSTCSKHVEVNY